MPDLDVPSRRNNTWLTVSNVIDIWKRLEEKLQRIRSLHAGYVYFTILPTDRCSREINPKTWFVTEDFRVFLKPIYDNTTFIRAFLYAISRLILPLYRQLKWYVYQTLQGDD